MKDYLPPHQAVLAEKSGLENLLGEESKISLLMLCHGLNIKFRVFYPASRGIPELQQCPFCPVGFVNLGACGGYNSQGGKERLLQWEGVCLGPGGKYLLQKDSLSI